MVEILRAGPALYHEPTATTGERQKQVRIGFILECGPQGTDKRVYEHLALQVDGNAHIIRTVTLTNKPLLIASCGKQAALLLDEGCERVIIGWDLYPAWRSNERPDCHEDVRAICASLAAANVDDARVRLLCISEELEAWVLADERALSAYLSRQTHHFPCPRQRNPDTVRNPKKRLHSLFSEAHRGRYVDTDHALHIVQQMPDFARLLRVQSFARFARLITDADFTCQRV